MTIVKALKKLSKKLNTGGTEATGKTIGSVLESIESNFNINGSAGADGKSVTAITLYTTEGAVTSGVATLSDSSTIDITVTTEPEGE